MLGSSANGGERVHPLTVERRQQQAAVAQVLGAVEQ